MTTIDQSPTAPTTTTNPRRAAVTRSSAARAERRLRRVLRANAATSVISGAVLAVAAAPMADLLGTGHMGWVRTVGIAVALFGLDVAWLSRRPTADLARFTPFVVTADAAWVVLSVTTLLLGWFSGAGIAAVIAMAVAVDAFGFLQFAAWRELRATR